MTHRARALMVWGASSNAGKSLIATALCRCAAQRGIVVAPFKAQNMSNHARVVPGLGGGFGEIGSAQYFQALAARVSPHVDMNPVLLKPERDTASQAIVHGRADPLLSRLPWRERSAQLAQAACQSYERLAAQYELIVIEGAGSPAEINLAGADYVNLEVMHWSGARALLVVDIDRGGAFAHAFGTWSLLPDTLRGRLDGFVFNKFRGDATLLAPGPEQLQRLTGVPLAAVVPMLRDHGLPEEDGVMDFGAPSSPSGELEIVVVAYPRASNLDEFAPLRRVPGARLRWARSAAEAQSSGWIVLPGSKQVSGDLAWLRAQGIDRIVMQHAGADRPVLGICGGLQMLGQRLIDPDGADGEPGVDVPGLGLLPVVTEYRGAKRVRPSTGAFGEMSGPFAALSGLRLGGYEIRVGQTRVVSPDACAIAIADDGEPLAWQRGPVLGSALHGLFEEPPAVRRLFGRDVRGLDVELDRLAEQVGTAFHADALARLLGL